MSKKSPKPPKPTTSAKRIAANRANAAKSTGPTTLAGKRKSAQNARRDNLLARAILIEGEDRAAFLKHSNSLHNEFLPASDVERALLKILIVTSWRQLRFWEMEKSLVNREIHSRDHIVAPENCATRAATAFSALSDTPAFAIFNRYELRYDRQYHRARKRLHEVQDRRFAAENKNTQNEPNEIRLTR